MISVMILVDPTNSNFFFQIFPCYNFQTHILPPPRFALAFSVIHHLIGYFKLHTISTDFPWPEIKPACLFCTSSPSGQESKINKVIVSAHVGK